MPPREPSGEGFLDHGGVRLHWLEWMPEAQRRAPDLFLLHGLSSNARYWERLARRFPHRRLVALDQRAHGASDAPDAGYAMPDLTGDAAFALEALGLERPVVAGHSWGASVALDLAATHPERVSAVATLDGATMAMSERLSWEDAARMMQPPLPRYRVLEDAFASSRALLEEAWDRDLEAFVAAGLRPDGEALVLPLTAAIRRQILRSLFDFRPDLAWPAYPGPGLLGVARGDAGLQAWKEEGVKRVLAVRPDVRVRWYDSRHDIPLIRTDEVAADLEALAAEALPG